MPARSPIVASASACTLVGPNYVFLPSRSLSSSLSLSFFSLSLCNGLFQTHETTLYLHTSTNPESFRVPCFSIARVHAGLASADLRLPASGSFLSFCSSLSFSLWYARNINGHLCSRLTVDNFFLFCRWILCLLCFFSYFSFEINLPSSVFYLKFYMLMLEQHKSVVYIFIFDNPMSIWIPFEKGSGGKFKNKKGRTREKTVENLFYLITCAYIYIWFFNQ